MSASKSSSLNNNEKNNLIVGNSSNDNLKYNNCVAIRQEIQRFESVHPSIYAIYDLLELNSDQVLSLQIREHLLSIEDSFVNSQEWTLSRNVPDLRLGIVGNLDSGKSALVHRYLTGSYMQDESPEGGRFKKEVFIHGQSNMLLIRDEGGVPEMQFSCWVDAVIFVFSVDNLESYEAIKEYYQKLAAYRSNLDQVPLILVGTQEIDSSGQRVIDEFTAKRLAEEMQRDCVYYETCATYGHNVDKVFQDACQRIIQARSLFGITNCPSPAAINHTPSYLSSNQYHPYSSRPTTPNNQTTPNNNNYLNNNYNNGRQPHSPLSTFTYQSPLGNQQSQPNALNSSLRKSANTPLNKNFGNLTNNIVSNNLPANSISASKAKEQHIFISPNNPIPPKRMESKNQPLDNCTNTPTTQLSSTVFTPISTIKEALQQNAPKNNPNLLPISTTIGSGQHPPVANKLSTPVNSSSTTEKASKTANIETPTSTPNQNRKGRRKSKILFSYSSSKNKNLEEKSRNGELGSGRAIPLRQGYLHKKSVNSSLNTKLSLKNKEWKKKYVTLTTDGCLTYHSSLHDYMNDTHGKKISLMHTTVKIPGQKPRGSSIITSQQSTTTAVDNDFNRLNLLNNNQNNNQINCTVNEMCIDGGNLSGKCVNCGLIFNTLDDRRLIPSTNPSLKDKDSSKKKHRRHKSEQLKNMALTTTNAYCERCATILENVNGFVNSSTGKASDSANGHEDEDFVFVIVSLDNKQWHFQAQSAEDRENWLQAIENQILLSLQNIQSDKEKLRNVNSEQSNNEKIFKDQIKQIAGNNYCLDCDDTNPTWASLNLGGLICIECSGIHRNLGTHISKVRSIDLDDWPQGNISVMLALGNSAVNKIWEYNTKNLNKPVPTSNREEKELWIRKKYERKEFLCPLSNQASDQLESSIRNQDIRKVYQIISQLNGNQTPLNEFKFKFNGNQRCTPLQLAVSTNNIAITQLIIWCNGNINASDDNGQNAFAYAKTNEMKQLLRLQGCTESKLPLGRSPNSSLINRNFNRNDQYANNFTLRENYLTRDTNSAHKTSSQMSGLVTSDVFDQLPTSII